MINEFLELCRGRQSIRKFTAESVPDEALKQILEAAQTAPSAGNLQAYKIVLVKEPQTKQMLAAASLNLATTWVGAFRDKEVKAAVGTEAYHVPVALLPVGHAGGKPRRTDRRHLQNIVKVI